MSDPEELVRLELNRLTGHHSNHEAASLAVEAVRAAGLLAVPARPRVPSASEPQWRIGIEVPMSLPGEQRHDLFERAAALVHDWEPEDRDGWDVNVYGCPVSDDAPDHFHPALAEHDNAVRDSELLRSRLALVLTELLRGGTTDRDRRKSAYAVLTADQAICGHGWPFVLVDCPKCDAPTAATPRPEEQR